MADRTLDSGQLRESTSFSFPGDTGNDLIAGVVNQRHRLAPNTKITASAACKLLFETDGQYLTQLNFPGPGVFGITEEDDIVSLTGQAITVTCAETAVVDFTTDYQVLKGK